MDMKTFLDKFGKSVAESLEELENRYFIYHIPKNEDYDSKKVKTIYFHEPILNNIQLHSKYPKGIRFGYAIEIEVDVDEDNEYIYIINIGFSIIHSKRIALIFSENLKDTNLQMKLKELIYYLEMKGQYFGKVSVDENGDQSFIDINAETIPKIPKKYPLKEGSFRGSYFNIFYTSYDEYYDLESIIFDHKRLARELNSYFSFLYKALFPKRDKKFRGTDQYRLLTNWFKKNNIEKQCEISGCDEFSHLEIHHIKPISEGGKDIIENLICLCKKHHREAHQYKSYINKDMYYIGKNKYKLKDFTYNRINKIKLNKF